MSHSCASLYPLPSTELGFLLELRCCYERGAIRSSVVEDLPSFFSVSTFRALWFQCTSLSYHTMVCFFDRDLFFLCAIPFLALRPSFLLSPLLYSPPPWERKGKGGSGVDGQLQTSTKLNWALFRA